MWRFRVRERRFLFWDLFLCCVASEMNLLVQKQQIIVVQSVNITPIIYTRAMIQRD